MTVHLDCAYYGIPIRPHHVTTPCTNKAHLRCEPGVIKRLHRDVETICCVILALASTFEPFVPKSAT